MRGKTSSPQLPRPEGSHCGLRRQVVEGLDWAINRRPQGINPESEAADAKTTQAWPQMRRPIRGPAKTTHPSLRPWYLRPDP